jgi:hypothetical protein
MKMADVLSSKQRSHVQRLNAMVRTRRMLNLKRKGEKLISRSTLKALQAARLPLSKRAYTMKLRELEA